LSVIPHPPTLIIAGPTGVGKSRLGMAVALRTRGEIIVADSMQVYRRMDIGTGKPSLADRGAVPHHLVDLCDPREQFSAFEFARLARLRVTEARARGGVPILVGGTGLYLRAFLKGQLSGPSGDPTVRARLRAQAARSGSASLHARLRELDPTSADRIRPGDLFRIIRALELHELAGKPASAIRPGLWDLAEDAASACFLLVLMRDRQELYRLIDARAERMWEAGLLEETRTLLDAGYAADLRPLQALGYRQAVAVLQGRMGEAEALAEMQRATRNYAKRQVTWFRREPAAEWVTVQGDAWVEPLAAAVLARLAHRGPAAGPLRDRDQSARASDRP
jgi:tRNA dimethylallyltransferase